MRLRHVAAAVGFGLLLLAAAAAGTKPPEERAPIGLNDGTIQVSATVAGRGSWVPYTITVRNLGEQRFEGDMLLVNRPQPGTSVVTTLPPIAGAPLVTSPVTAAAIPVAPPDAAYEVHLVLDPRHRKVITFTAPGNYGQAEVVDSAGHQVAEVPISDRNVLPVGVVSDTVAVGDELALLRFGDLGVRPVTFDSAHPLPVTAVGFAGLVAVVFDGTDSGTLSSAQVRALREFVGFGGTLVVAGSTRLAAALRGVPADLVPVQPTGVADGSLQALADLGLLTAPARTSIAVGNLASTARAVLATPEGRPLVAELVYGSGRVVELLYEPNESALLRAGVAGLGWSNALSRGLERLPGSLPVGGTLLEPESIPSDLLPKPGDAPLPSLAVVLALGSLYILVVGPATFLALRSARRPTLYWVAAPLLAVAFSLTAYAAGQAIQGGVRDQQVEFLKVGPAGSVSTLSYHGITFPLRGRHEVQLPPGSVAAPLTLGYPALELSCRKCPFQVAGVQTGVEEHVVPGRANVVVEKGIVYGSVRVVGEASTGALPVSLDVHLKAVADHLIGTVANRGSVPLTGVRLYAFYGDMVRSATVAASLPPGSSREVDVALTPVNDFTAPIATRGGPAAGVLADLVANAAAERGLTRSGQVAVVGFVTGIPSALTVDGDRPPRRSSAAIVETFGLEGASGRLGNWTYARLNSTVAGPGANGGFLDTYDIEVPPTETLPVFRYDNRVYREVEVYDWTTATWRSSGFADDALSPLVKVTPIAPAEFRDGRVRVRVRESALTWGQELVLRFPGEAP